MHDEAPASRRGFHLSLVPQRFLHDAKRHGSDKEQVTELSK
jgi:predicted metal-dependent phosphotriesterase family hydrolase